MQLNGPVWYPYMQMKTAGEPLKIIRGSGIYLYDDTEKRYIDAISSWWVNIHGHANTCIGEAIAKQAEILEQVIFAGCTHQPAIDLATRLLEKCAMPEGKVFFSDNGSTAIEIAVKMAVQYYYNQGKPRTSILAWANDFHGETFGAMSVSDQSGLNAAFGELMFASIKVRIPAHIDDEDSWTILEQHLTSGNIAAFIFEPLIQGTGGMVMYDAAILQRALNMARDSGVLLIADEVMTGTYRTGTYLATQQTNIVPDMICLAKGLTGGFLPLSVTVAQHYVFEAFLSEQKNKALFHGHSYTANPLGCAAAIASLQLCEKPDFIKNVDLICKINHQKVQDFSQIYPDYKPRSCGTIFAMNFPDTQTGYFSGLFDIIHRHFLDRGIFLRPLGNVLYIMPPLVISAEELHYIFDEIEAFIKANFK